MGKRVGIIDEVRGLDYIAMILYHLYFDLAFVYAVDLPEPVDVVMRWLQPLIAGTFIFIAGISSIYSRNNFKRGVEYFFIAMCMTFVTAIVMPSEVIVFGVLHFMGIAVMLYGFIGMFTERIPWVIGVVLFGLLYAVTLNVPFGYVGFDGAFTLKMPEILYQNDYMFPLGFRSERFFSGDYFPLIPNFFLFLAGASFGEYFKAGGATKGMYSTRFTGLAFLGRHGLWIYILHQPVLLLILEIVFKITGGKTLFL